MIIVFYFFDWEIISWVSYSIINSIKYYKKDLFTPWKLGSIKLSKYLFLAFWIAVSDWYLFLLIVRLNPDFNGCKSFALPWADKVTTQT